MAKLHRRMKYLNPGVISFDEHNPRGLSKEQIVRSPHFEKLVNSIKEHGLIEPLIVKPNDSITDSFILIDGERRLRASLKAKEEEVPARIAKDDTDGRILAYHAHMLREDWDKAAETKAIKIIILDLEKDDPDITEAEIRSKLKGITAHKTHDLSDILKLIKYDDDVIDKVISKQLDMSYLVQIESSFMSPLNKHYPDIYSEYDENQLRTILVNKAMSGKLVNTRFLMDKFKIVFTDNKNIDAIQNLLRRFLDNESISIKKIYDDHEKLLKGKSKNKKTTSKKAKKKTSTKKIAATSGTFTYRTLKVNKRQQTQIHDVREEFESVAETYSKEENEYLKEALHCLETHCFKAATLMIWSSGVSRILRHIDKNLSNFNSASIAMKREKKSSWKYFAQNFQSNVSSIEEIQLRSNDIHLLCYLVYMEIISPTEFKKLRSNYDIRNDCAHPTDIKLSVNEIISIFENINNYILSNLKLK